MKSILKYTFRLFDKLFPAIKFKKKYFKQDKEYVPTDEDLDKWATEFLERQENERRRRRANKN